MIRQFMSFINRQSQFPSGFKLSFPMQINRSDEDHYDARKQSLIQQILSYTNRIQQYKGLENELKTISFAIENEQFNTDTQTPTVSKTASRKSLDHSDKRTLQVKKDPNQRRISSSKKIKLYELQKKLARINKDHNQKFSSLISQKRQQQVILQTICQLSELTENENLKLIQFQKEDFELAEQLISKNTEYLKVKKYLEQVCEKKQSYVFEKQSFLAQIRSQKKSVEQMQSAISEVQSQIFTKKQNQSNANPPKRTEPFGLKLNKIEQNTMKNEYLVPDHDNYYSQIDRNSRREELRDVEVDGVTYKIVDSNNSFESLEMNPPQACSQESTNIFSVLKDKVQMVQSQNCDLNEEILKFKREMISIETEIKHHKTSLDLLKQKLKMKKLFIEREKTTHLQNISTIQSIRKILSDKEGERGEMRGRIGTRVDQEGILKLINTTLEKDLENLKEKTDCLIVYRNMLCGQIIQFK